MKTLGSLCLIAICAAPTFAGTVTLMSPAGAPIVPTPETGNGASVGQASSTSASADGRWIAFTSAAANLVPGQVDSNSANDVFLRDRVNGTTVLVSHLPGTFAATANGAADLPSISSDGRWIAFVSAATNLVTGQTDGNFVQDVFLYDRTTGQVVLLSHTSGSAVTTANGLSDKPAMAADGTVVAFRSAGSNLIAGVSDGNGAADLFLYDVAAGTTALASRTAASATTAAGGVSSDAPSLSADGRYVAFTATVANLVTGQSDTNGAADVFVHDRNTGITVLASRNSTSPTATANGLSDQPAISADGNWVAFRTAGINLGVSDSNGTSDIWVFDRAAGTNLLVSRRALAPLRPGSNTSGTPALSSDGRYIAYASASNNLVTGQIDNGNWDVFVFDRTTLLNTLVSRSSASAVTDANAGSTAPTISLDGAWIAYLSDATNLVSGQTDANQAQATRSDVFVFDRAAGTNALASRSASVATTTANKSSDRAAVARGGGFVVFTSAATDVISGLTDVNSANDVFAWERATGTNAPVSRRDTGPIGGTGNGTSKVPGATPTALSADGRWAAVVSNAANLVSGITDTNATDDVYLFDRDTGTLTLVSRTSGSATTTGNGASNRAVVSADGNWVAFVSGATNLVSGFTTSFPTDQIYLWERATGSTILVTHVPGTTTAGASTLSTDPVVSDDGSVVAFVSQAIDLVSGQVDSSNTDDVFFFDRASGTITLASSSSASPVTAGNGRSYRVRLSGDGQWLAFNTYATNLVSGVTDTNSSLDVYLVELATGTKTLASHTAASALQTPVGASLTPSLSADGRFLAFESQGWNLVSGQVDANNGGDVFLFDRTTGTNTVMSHSTAGAAQAGNSTSEDPQVSADGNWVAFLSRATDLFSFADANGTSGDIVLYEVASGGLTLVSHAASSLTTSPNYSSILPAVSADGGAVVFLCNGTNLISGQIDPNTTTSDVYLWDRATGVITLASRDLVSPVTTGNGTSPTFPPRPSISAAGTTVIFATDSSNLAANDVNGLWDAFLFQP